MATIEINSNPGVWMGFRGLENNEDQLTLELNNGDKVVIKDKVAAMMIAEILKEWSEKE